MHGLYRTLLTHVSIDTDTEENDFLAVSPERKLVVALTTKCLSHESISSPSCPDATQEYSGISAPTLRGPVRLKRWRTQRAQGTYRERR